MQKERIEKRTKSEEKKRDNINEKLTENSLCEDGNINTDNVEKVRKLDIYKKLKKIKMQKKF